LTRGLAEFAEGEEVFRKRRTVGAPRGNGEVQGKFEGFGAGWCHGVGGCILFAITKARRARERKNGFGGGRKHGTNRTYGTYEGAQEPKNSKNRACNVA